MSTIFNIFLNTLESDFTLNPTFFLPQKRPMIVPSDLADFLYEAMIETKSERVYEIIGPALYSTSDIAQIFGAVLNRNVTASRVLPEEWEDTLLDAGFSKDGANNLMLMTQAVIDGKARCETHPIQLHKIFSHIYQALWKVFSSTVNEYFDTHPHHSSLNHLYGRSAIEVILCQ